VLTFLFLAVVPVLAKDNEATIKVAVTERYRQWIAAENKKDAEAITDLYDENAVLMPKQEGESSDGCESINRSAAGG